MHTLATVSISYACQCHECQRNVICQRITSQMVLFPENFDLFKINIAFFDIFCCSKAYNKNFTGNKARRTYLIELNIFNVRIKFMILRNNF